MPPIFPLDNGCMGEGSVVNARASAPPEAFRKKFPGLGTYEMWVKGHEGGQA